MEEKTEPQQSITKFIQDTQEQLGNVGPTFSVGIHFYLGCRWQLMNIHIAVLKNIWPSLFTCHKKSNRSPLISSFLITGLLNYTYSPNSVNCNGEVVVGYGSTASFNGPHWFTVKKLITLFTKPAITKSGHQRKNSNSLHIDV